MAQGIPDFCALYYYERGVREPPDSTGFIVFERLPNGSRNLSHRRILPMNKERREKLRRIPCMIPVDMIF